MLRTRFSYQFLKMEKSEAKAKYNTQRNICVSSGTRTYNHLARIRTLDDLVELAVYLRTKWLRVRVPVAVS